MSTGPLRLAVAVLVLVLLVRAGIGAWRHRELAFAVWRRVTLRHLFGAAALLTVVASLGYALLGIPLLGVGLGDVVGFSGNAVFTPLQEAAVRAGPAPETGPDWAVIAIATAFLAFLGLLLPWLAFVEEEIFRAGLEISDRRGEVLTAVRFGAVHLIMLVPVAAALAIAVAGFVYGRIYVRAYREGRTQDLPPVAGRLYRPTRRARRAVHVQQLRTAVAARGTRSSGVSTVTEAPPEERQVAAVLASTVWHATFNSLVVALLWALIVADAAGWA